jgi:hypothetical protein
MKKLIALAFCLASFSVMYAQEPAQSTNPDNAPNFKFKEEKHDFGTIPEGTPVTYVFEFTNTGKEPLIIKDATASCGCTSPVFEHQPVMPNKKGKVTVTYNAKAVGPFNKPVTITSNAKESTKVIYITGTVKEKTAPADNTAKPAAAPAQH